MTEAAHRVDFWRPDARLARYVTGYHRYIIVLPPGQTVDEAVYPAWANLRFTFPHDAHWSVRIGRRAFDPVPDPALFGPSSHACYIRAPAGTMVGAGLTPVGWARLVGGEASLHADRVVAADAVFGSLAELGARIAAADDPAVPLDAWFLARLAAMPCEDPLVAAMLDHLDDPDLTRVAELAERTGATGRQVLRAARANFGFTPKLLLRRARFLRALVAAHEHGGPWAEAARHAGYWDGSHFLRDCHLFLGRALGSFVAMDRPLSRDPTRQRNDVLGAPMQAVFTVPAQDEPDDAMPL